MRAKYIELIKEYIKQKPEYRSALDELKADVLTVGATEEEFDEAIKEFANLGEPSEEMLKEESVTQVYEKAPQKNSPSSSIYAQKVLRFTRNKLLTKKKYIVAFAFALIIVVLATQIGKKSNLSKTTVANITKSVEIPKINTGSTPIVYANSKPIDPGKIFSVKSSKIHLAVTGIPKKEILGFFPYWMLSEEDKIDLSALTSISLFGLDVDGQGNIMTTGSDKESGSGWDMWKDPRLDTLIKRARNKNLKVYLTFKSFDNSNIESLTQSDTAQKNFIANALYLLNSKSLDGINIDFEYVGSPPDKVTKGFTRFITNLNSELKRQIPQSVLTIDTYLVSGADNGLFNILLLSSNSDAFVIMGYDMHTPLGNPGPISAMGGETNIVGYVQNYLEKVGPDKLILAVPYYGYDWPQSGQSASDAKTLPYAEIALSSKNLQLSWNDTSQTPSFTYKDGSGAKRVVHFDNIRSLGIKYDFINKKDLRGVGIWALGYDGENQDLEKLLIDKFINQ